MATIDEPPNKRRGIARVNDRRRLQRQSFGSCDQAHHRGAFVAECRCSRGTNRSRQCLRMPSVTRRTVGHRVKADVKLGRRVVSLPQQVRSSPATSQRRSRQLENQPLITAMTRRPYRYPGGRCVLAGDCHAPGTPCVGVGWP